MATVIVKKDCPFCGQDNGIEVDMASYEKWQGGAFVQNAFPTLTAEEREVLVSGSHADCWDEAYDDEEDDDE